MMKKTMKLLVLVFLIPVLVACSMSRAVNLREGIASFRVEDYRNAFVRLKPLAIKGERDAQYAVGYMYYYGKGVVEDRKKARFWIGSAANLGQPDAKVALELLDGKMK